MTLSCQSEKKSGNDKNDVSAIDYATVLDNDWTLESTWKMIDTSKLIGCYFGIDFEFIDNQELIISTDSFTSDGQEIRITSAPIYFSLHEDKLTIDSCEDCVYFVQGETYEMKMAYPFQLELLPSNLQNHQAIVLSSISLFQSYQERED